MIADQQQLVPKRKHTLYKPLKQNFFQRIFLDRIEKKTPQLLLAQRPEQPERIIPPPFCPEAVLSQDFRLFTLRAIVLDIKRPSLRSRGQPGNTRDTQKYPSTNTSSFTIKMSGPPRHCHRWGRRQEWVNAAGIPTGKGRGRNGGTKR
ncbi:hypothetical protein AVEN_269598-1 [Araneus ventricosus]|uniref:Uncharacterized protein n=1 Tax=Araneus ventricosus TaxID=182803 RepID=A0A4Y2CDQ0_ARAVE|nr:hypothetical protein AVEN_269598-1 [Araneus ventricosus]